MYLNVVLIYFVYAIQSMRRITFNWYGSLAMILCLTILPLFSNYHICVLCFICIYRAERTKVCWWHISLRSDARIWLSTVVARAQFSRRPSLSRKRRTAAYSVMWPKQSKSKRKPNNTSHRPNAPTQRSPEPDELMLLSGHRRVSPIARKKGMGTSGGQGG